MYDDAFEPAESDLDSSGQWTGKSAPSPRYGSLPSDNSGVNNPSDRSGSLKHGRAPRLRTHRHYSDVTDPRRRKRFVVVITTICPAWTASAPLVHFALQISCMKF